MGRIGLLTGGGDAPGLNGIIAAVVRALAAQGHEVHGVLDGFEGVYEGRTRRLTVADVSLIHGRSGTILGTSNRVGTQGREEEFYRAFQALRLDGLVVAGGDGTFAGLGAFLQESAAYGPPIPVVGVPKTIDNDLSGTELTFGFDTARAVVADAVDELRHTAEAHRRVLVVEAMGRTAGWIALGGGLASYADAILIPERPFAREALLAHVRRRQRAGQRGFVLVAAEGATAEGESVTVARSVAGSPEPTRLGGVGSQIAAWLEEETGWESRVVVLGHLQRGRAPTPTDRFLTTTMGAEAARMVDEGAYGQAVVFRGGAVGRAPIGNLVGPPRRVPAGHPWLLTARTLGVFV